jgi:hypothetical protein
MQLKQRHTLIDAQTVAERESNRNLTMDQVTSATHADIYTLNVNAHTTKTAHKAVRPSSRPNRREPNKRKVGIPMTNKLELKQGDKLYHDHDGIIIFPPRKQRMTENEKEMIRIAFEKAFSEDDEDIKDPIQEEREGTE